MEGTETIDLVLQGEEEMLRRSAVSLQPPFCSAACRLTDWRLCSGSEVTSGLEVLVDGGDVGHDALPVGPLRVHHLIYVLQRSTGESTQETHELPVCFPGCCRYKEFGWV